MSVRCYKLALQLNDSMSTRSENRDFSENRDCTECIQRRHKVNTDNAYTKNTKKWTRLAVKLARYTMSA